MGWLRETPEEKAERKRQQREAWNEAKQAWREARDEIKGSNNGKPQLYFRECDACGFEWVREKNADKRARRNARHSALTEGVNLLGKGGFGAQNRYNTDNAANQLEAIRSCPRCGSRKYTEQLREWKTDSDG